MIYVGGTFDLLHEGHIELLREASKFGKVVVALNTDDFCKRYKGKKPVLPYSERKILLESVKYVHLVIENIGGEDSKVTINALKYGLCKELKEQIKIDAVAHGTDWIGDSLYKQMSFTQEWLNKELISMIYIPRTTGESTTRIKAKINE